MHRTVDPAIHGVDHTVLAHDRPERTVERGAGEPDLDAETAAHEVPVPARWFLGQSCILRTDKAVAELDYQPMVSHATGLDAVRNSVSAAGA
ncbi:hypothetical protein ABZ817_10885 [Streptomyces antimycoticus]|uniref:hypothetical protein n=1 Tax=Streptomyces antimycoticus TaxID=68175 RepID=UPI0034116F4C